jgi:NADPH2:quinone reductase
MTRGILMHGTGGPEVLQWSEFELPRLKRNEAKVKHTAIGVNYIDVYDRTGLYAAKLPLCLGREAAGVIEAVGAGVKGFAPGDRVAYVLATPGSYAEARHVPVDRLVKIPDGISDAQAAGIMLKGMTAYYLLHRTHKLKKREPIVIHAAAGGVGLLLVQWARYLGAHVIGVVGSEEKAKIAIAHGANDVILSSANDLVPQVRARTKGKGVAVVYDAVGKDTFEASLDCLAPLGLMVSYGNASGPVSPVAPLELTKRGSLFLTRPSLFHYIASKADLKRAASSLFGVVGQGIVKVRIDNSYPLADARQAHIDLEARRTTGSVILLPG